MITRRGLLFVAPGGLTVDKYPPDVNPKARWLLPLNFIGAAPENLLNDYGFSYVHEGYLFQKKEKLFKHFDLMKMN